MLIALAVFEALLAIAVIALLLKKPAAATDPGMTSLAAELTAQLTRLDAHFNALDTHLRGELAQLRTDNAAAATALRQEVLGNLQTLGETLRTTLGDFGRTSTTSAEGLRTAVDAQLRTLGDRFTAFTSDVSRTQADAAAALHTALNELKTAQGAQHLQLRDAMQQRLDKLNTDNSNKLEEMRATVNEKLQHTLNARLTESFGQVATHLGEVQKGLGEMKELASGVGDLKKVLTNVKSRGIVGEFILGQQLEQMFSPEQYVKNARIKADTSEAVEYALKFPNGPDSTVLLAIDSKFPREVGERLMHVYDHGTADEIAATGREFERAIRAEGDKICRKYIDPPTTLPHAVMFLPTEALYAEVVRRPGLQSELQQKCSVTIAGPSTFMAILTSFQLGFHTMAVEKKGNQVWRVLATAKKEFETFGDLMSSMEKQVGTVQNTIQKLGVRSRAIGRSLKDVSTLDSTPTPEELLTTETIPMLLAGDGE